MPARKLDFYINASKRLRSLAADARRLAQLQQVFLQHAPPSLTRASHVSQLRAGTLFLLAENAAIAAKLRQLAPRLLTTFQIQGVEVTSIRIEVQVKDGSAPAQTPRKINALSVETIENLQHFAEALDDSPLKQALTNLAAHQRAKN